MEYNEILTRLQYILDALDSKMRPLTPGMLKEEAQRDISALKRAILIVKGQQ